MTLTANAADPAMLHVLPDEIRTSVAAQADSVDQGHSEARSVLAMLGAESLADLGAPSNTDGRLAAMSTVIAGLAAECVSAAFTTWAHRMAIEYLAAADTDYARGQLPGLRDGSTPGVTAMASAFRDLAGCGSLELTATAAGDGYLLNGPIRWASNLYDDAVMVTAAATGAGERIIVALPLSTPGVAVGKPFSLLALNATASSSITLTDVRVGTDNILSTDFVTFLGSVRPTFLVLQTAICVGLARTCLANAHRGLSGVNAVFAEDVQQLSEALAQVESTMLSTADALATPSQAGRAEMLTMRLTAAELASAAAALEARTAGGKGYASRSGASRRFREAAFIPVQSPSEAQLRWELAQCRQ